MCTPLMCMEAEIIWTDCYCSLAQAAAVLQKETPSTAALQTAVHLYGWAQADADAKILHRKTPCQQL